ncbi:MAG: hypothetical protein AAGF57_01955 [Pseudomonadota bacterium]
MFGSGSKVQSLSPYLLPGLVFQSVIVGGGYGTGREIAEFFVVHGPLGGLLGMLVACVAWSVVLAVAFEFARVSRAYDYRSFFKALLGRSWGLFEIIYLLIALLVLAVLGSAAGELLNETLGITKTFGAVLLMGAVGALVYFGSSAVERALACWSILLYVVYTLFFIWVIAEFGNVIGARLGTGEVLGAWHLDGLRYAAYNLNALAATLFVLSHLETRQQAIGAGLLAGLIGIVPGIFVFVSMLAQYPQIAEAPVPITNLLHALNALWFFVIFQIVLFGTFIETGAGIIHAINERVASALQESKRKFPAWARLAIAVSSMLVAVFLADAFGIVGLIAQGYGLLSYAFIAIVVLPLLTLGVRRIVLSSRQTSRPLAHTEEAN